MLSNIEINRIRVSKFRGIKRLELSLSKITILVGMNNSGKTSIIKALELALGSYSRSLQEEDYYLGDGNRERKIVIDVRIEPKESDSFSDEWRRLFGEGIQRTAEEKFFVGIRTTITDDDLGGGFKIKREYLREWQDFLSWPHVDAETVERVPKLESLHVISVGAQRDIHADLSDRHSFLGKTLRQVVYDGPGKDELERKLSELSLSALENSSVLRELKSHLDSLNSSIDGSVELTTFPKKLDDLSKNTKIFFGTPENSFPMEYHGMGTRSWASILTARAFMSQVGDRYRDDHRPVCSFLTLEEPEAHLHPNAQRTIFKQIQEVRGQVIVSTHSPYLASLARLEDIRSVCRKDKLVEVNRLGEHNDEIKRKIQREVMDSRGELLFSRVIVLVEGVTETHALPLLFEEYFETTPFSVGVNFVGIGGSGPKYAPFLGLARDFDIPVFIFSDGEIAIRNKLRKVCKDYFPEIDAELCDWVTILPEGHDFEAYLISTIPEIIEQVITESKVTDWIEQHTGKSKKGGGIQNYDDPDGRTRAMNDILDRDKTGYASLIAQELCSRGKENFPEKFTDLFEKINSRL